MYLNSFVVWIHFGMRNNLKMFDESPTIFQCLGPVQIGAGSYTLPSPVANGSNYVALQYFPGSRDYNGGWRYGKRKSKDKIHVGKSNAFSKFRASSLNLINLQQCFFREICYIFPDYFNFFRQASKEATHPPSKPASQQASHTQPHPATFSHTQPHPASKNASLKEP